MVWRPRILLSNNCNENMNTYISTFWSPSRILQNGHNLFVTLHTCRHIKKWFHGLTANMAVIYHAVYTMTHRWWITETCTLTSTQISTHSYYNNLYFLLSCSYVWFSLHLWIGCDTFVVLFTYLTFAFYIPEDGHMVDWNM